MTEEVYFFDTYALMEILQENTNYKKYINKVIILTQLNIFELFYNLLFDCREDIVKEITEIYNKSAVLYDKETIDEAAIMRFTFKNRKISMTDCIGYTIAKKLNIKFLTGDEQFKDLPNVEFVK